MLSKNKLVEIYVAFLRTYMYSCFNMSMNLHVDEFACILFIVFNSLLVNCLLNDKLNRIFVLNDFSQLKLNFFINYKFFNIRCYEFSCILHPCD